jgi:ribosomal protein S18 acetylase RimI-like enzyme
MKTSNILLWLFKETMVEHLNNAGIVVKSNKAQNLYKKLGFEIYDENEYSYFMKTL